MLEMMRIDALSADEAGWIQFHKNFVDDRGLDIYLLIGGGILGFNLLGRLRS